MVTSITGLITSTLRVFENDTWQNVSGMAFFTVWLAICLTNIELERKSL
jgi:amino acid permease